MKHIILSLATVSLVYGVSSCSSAKKSIDISENENNTFEVTIKKGTTYGVSMKENISTGYSWQMDTPKDTPQNCAVAFLKVDYKRDNAPKNFVGVGGTKFYYFAALQEGECTITFKHGRGWESEERQTYKKVKFIVIK